MVAPVSIGAGLRLFPEAREKHTWAPSGTVQWESSAARIDIYRLQV